MVHPKVAATSAHLLILVVVYLFISDPWEFPLLSHNFGYAFKGCSIYLFKFSRCFSEDIFLLASHYFGKTESEKCAEDWVLAAGIFGDQVSCLQMCSSCSHMRRKFMVSSPSEEITQTEEPVTVCQCYGCQCLTWTWIFVLFLI